MARARMPTRTTGIRVFMAVFLGLEFSDSKKRILIDYTYSGPQSPANFFGLLPVSSDPVELVQTRPTGHSQALTASVIALHSGNSSSVRSGLAMIQSRSDARKEPGFGTAPESSQ